MTARRSKFENEYLVRSNSFQIFLLDDLKEIQVWKWEFCALRILSNFSSRWPQGNPSSKTGLFQCWKYWQTFLAIFPKWKIMIESWKYWHTFFSLHGGAPQKILGFYDLKLPGFHEIVTWKWLLIGTPFSIFSLHKIS